jgi:molecular chaperone DnaK
MRKEAEAHSAEDKKHHGLIEARNVADNSIYAAEKVLAEYGEKVPPEIKAEVQAAVDEVKKAKDGEDEAAIRKAVDALSKSVQKIGAAVYQQAPEQPAPEAGAGEPKPDAGPEAGSGESGPAKEGPDVVEGEAKDV